MPHSGPGERAPGPDRTARTDPAPELRPRYFDPTSRERARRNRANRERRRRVGDALLALYGHRCVCCGESARQFLTLDHVNGDGRAERAKGGGDLGWRARLLRRVAVGALDPAYRVLCFNCNIARHNWGYCHAASEAAG